MISSVPSCLLRYNFVAALRSIQKCIFDFFTSLVSEGRLFSLLHDVLSVAADEEGHVQGRA